MKEFPAETLVELNTKDWKEWFEEGLQISINFVYNGLSYGDKPTKAYSDRAWDVLRRRITIGGYRLANFIVDLYDAYKTASDNLEKEKFLILLE
jgi:hypothetical protein